MPKVLTEDLLIGEPIHEWMVKEYSRVNRGPWWYITMITLGIIFVVYALWTDNFLFALIVILFGIILYLQSNQESPEVVFAITDLGVVVGHKFYTFREFNSFYIIYQPPEVKTLFLQTKSAFRPIVRVPLEDMNPVEVRSTLLQYLEEDVEKQEEPLGDLVSRRWKIQ